MSRTGSGGSTKPVIIVAGLGRCGSSLTMQMLAAAGVDCVGDAPGYEDVVNANHEPIEAAWLMEQQGRALKVLTPLLTRVPDGVPARIIWLDRDATEQARSTLKFAAAMFGLATGGRRQQRAMSASFVKDREPSLRALPRMPRLEVMFEELVAAPLEVATRIAAFLRPDFDLDPARMATVVRKRGPECQAGLDIEVSLIEALSA